MSPRSALRAPHPTETANEFAADVATGLTAKPKYLPPKYFYDLTGSGLFDRITELPEYYPTRSEIGLLEKHAPEIASLFPQGSALVEFGGGSSRKARILLRAAASVEAYVPVDISGDFLREDAARLRRDFPHLSIIPVVADFTTLTELPAEIAALPRAGFFPGSTIGNFEPHEACKFLRRAGAILGSGSVLMVGVDLEKAPDILYRAYNDAQGVTAKFNLNLLVRINRELEGQFPISQFRHLARWNEGECAVEMHLESCIDQVIAIGGKGFAFRRGETIHTESSRKYEVKAFSEFARHHGWNTQRLWTDARRQFAIFGLI